MVTAFLLALTAAGTQKLWTGGIRWLRPLPFVTDATALRTSVLVASALALWGAFALRTAAEARLGEDVYGQGATERLLTDGPFAYCRNPLYLGTFLFFTSLSCLWAPLPVWAMSSALFFIALDRMIRHEEELLAKRYEASYEKYVAEVPRWRPKRPVAPAGPRPAPRRYAWAALGNLGLFSFGAFRLGVAVGGPVRPLSLLNLTLVTLWLGIILLRRLRRQRMEA